MTTTPQPTTTLLEIDRLLTWGMDKAETSLQRKDAMSKAQTLATSAVAALQADRLREKTPGDAAKKPLSLGELITAYGDDVRFQNLDQCATALDYHHKKGTTITFGTTENIHATEGTEKLGLVVWMDRARVKEIVAASKA